MSLQFRKGSNAERLTITPLNGEPIWTTDTHVLYVGDGVTVGGWSAGGAGGYTGSTGYTGSAGAGYTGSAGSQGYTGSAGAGSTGYTGSAGSTGYVGSKGYTGSAGSYNQNLNTYNDVVFNKVQTDFIGATSSTQLTIEGGINILSGITGAISNTATNFVITGPLSANTLSVTTTGTFATVISGNIVNTGYSSTGISGTSPVTIASFDTATSSAAKYLVRIKDGSNFHLVEIVVTTDGTDIHASEYGILTNAGVLGTFSYASVGGVIQTKFTPTSASSMTIKTAATLIPQ